MCALCLQFESDSYILSVHMYVSFEYRNLKSMEAYEEQLGCLKSLLLDCQCSRTVLIDDLNGDSKLCLGCRYGELIKGLDCHQ